MADLKEKIRNLRTTILGSMTIVGAVFTFASEWMQKGVMPNDDKLELLTGAIILGIGLITSADAKALKKVEEKIDEIK